jgi:hypothetical protein
MAVVTFSPKSIMAKGAICPFHRTFMSNCLFCGFPGFFSLPLLINSGAREPEPFLNVPKLGRRYPVGPANNLAWVASF